MPDQASISEVEAIVLGLLSQASNCTIEKLALDQRLRDFGIDSLGCHAMCVVLEAELGISLDPEELGMTLVNGRGTDLIDQVMALGPTLQPRT